MKNTTDSPVQVMPSATPTEQEIRDWNALSRDEQLRRLRESLTHPDCTVAAPETMRDILAVARSRASSRRG
jgi:hypothetical protein